MKPSPELTAFLNRISNIGLVAAGFGTIMCVFGFVSDRQFYPAYLTAFMYWLGLSLGCMGIAMIHGMTGGGWGLMVRRIVEAGYETLPLMAVLFLPIWLSVPQIYEWADPEFVQHHESVLKKAAYLNVAGFQGRAIGYFAIWIITTWFLNLYTLDEEPQSDSLRGQQLQRASGIGFMIYGFTFTLAGVDWLMSLEPEWYSTMYALIQIAGQGASAFSFAVLVAVMLREFKPWSKIVTTTRLHDYGNLMLASVMFWAYCSFFQYLVIWAGNLPEENSWYMRRSFHGWEILAGSLILLHFAVPFLLLLSRPLKRDPRRLSLIAILLLVMHYVDLYWIIVPGFQREHDNNQGILFLWLAPFAFLAIGGLWMTVFVWRLSIRMRLPIYDPQLAEGHR